MLRAPLTALALVAGCGGASRPVEKPAPPVRGAPTAADAQAIRDVLAEFMAAIQAKSGERLTALVTDPQILFTSPGEKFDGRGAGGFPRFVEFVTTTPDSIEERFKNVVITQDGAVAWAMFDYEFVANGKVSNYGIETWQLYRRDGKWRAFSVVWTQNEPPK